MNRTTFLFLALLIASCILTVRTRHEIRTVITEKSVLTERVNTLQETIRRLELENARIAAKKVDDDVPGDSPSLAGSQGKSGQPSSKPLQVSPKVTASAVAPKNAASTKPVDLKSTAAKH